jgi:hypothetical protein
VGTPTPKDANSTKASLAGFYQHRTPDGKPLFVMPGEDKNVTTLFASLLDPCVINSGKQITNSNLFRRESWLIGHRDFPDEVYLYELSPLFLMQCGG